MIFSSLLFLFIFMPIFLGIYYLVPFKFKNFILLVFSLLFYSWGEPIYITLLIFSSIVDYFNGILITKYEGNRKRQRIFLILSIIVNLSLLGVFKYSNFIVDNLNLFGFNIDIPNIALPLGISFFTFQTMSYSMDVYMGTVKAEKNFLNFMTYVSMFPQLVAGPIVRYEEVGKELHKRTINFDGFCKGLFKFLTGLFKKVLIANNVGLLFSMISSNPNISLASAWLGIIAYSLQIYFDFSGYSDMAVGLGRMLGFSYPENFNYPYIAKSITDFWRRWHMTLSTWFKDYVYFPLGGSRCSKAKNIRNLLIVWMLTGIWHGANWNFVIWGLYFGVILILEKTLLKKFLSKLPAFFQHMYAIFLIIIGWLIFAFDNMTNLINYSRKMFVNSNIIGNDFFFYFRNYFVFIIFGILFSIPIVKKIKLNKFWSVFLVITYLLLFIICIAMLVSDSYNPFLYFRF